MFDPVILKYQLRDAVIYWLLIPAAVVLSGKVIDWLFGFQQITHTVPQYIVSCFLVTPGFLLIWFSTRDLAEAGGTPNPLRPAKKLVTSGVYAICRHPMFLGYDLCAIAVVLFMGSPGMLLGSFPVFILLEIRFLQKEEKILLLKFKNSYAEYKKNTPFLVPMPFRSKRNLEQKQ